MPDYYGNTVINDDEIYDVFLEERDIERFIQYETKFFNKNIKNIRIRSRRYTWKHGDKLYKLAAKEYGDFRLWWVIALVNKISCDVDLKYGQVILIPLDSAEIASGI
tara:strand:- start:4 stop:324 length:321 start_codon:yes stop_codon:yes gene_type:complete